MLESYSSPLTRLVIFIVCTAIAASVISGAYYYAVELPQQQNIAAPQNNAMTDCTNGCISAFYTCTSGCRDDMCRYRCEVAEQACRNACPY